MKSVLKKFGFTLMEINLAVFIMAVGILAMVSLYPLGYRENEQSVDDVKAAAYADAVFNQVAGCLSARNLSWNDWESCVGSAVSATGASVGNKGGGWAKFCSTGSGYTPKKKGEINGISRSVFSALTSKAGQAGGSATWPVDANLTTALVAQWGIARLGNGNYQEDHSRVTLSMRVSHNAGSLFSQPIFLTEIHFQGDQKETNNQ